VRQVGRVRRVGRVGGALVVIFLLVCTSALTAQRATKDPQTLAKEGAAALNERRFDDALTAFSAAAAQLPNDANVATGAGLAAFMLGRSGDAETWFVRALRLRPNLTQASLVLGELQHRSGRLDEAIATYEAALKLAPKADTGQLEDRLTAWRKEQQLVGRFARSQGTHFTVLFEGPADEFLARRVLDYLESAYRHVGESLSAYPTQPITVVLYTTQQFQDITRMPGWTGAAYDGRIHVPVGGAMQATEQLDRVLTHEFVHAVVANIGGPAVPVWLNEGLATVLEPGGVAQSDAVLASVNVRPRLQQLHGSFSGLNAAQARLAYAYSAHAVQRIIALRGAYAVVGLLRDLARGVDFNTAFGKNAQMRYEEFDAMIRRD
jgi:tetratricopeptide (TPR) repeat protein